MTWKPDSIVGKLNKRITIQQNNATRDDYGAPAPPSWTTVKTIWAAIQPVSARDFIAGMAQQSEVTHKILVRDGAGITPDMQIAFGTRTFQILASPMNYDEACHQYTIMAKEVFEK